MKFGTLKSKGYGRKAFGKDLVAALTVTVLIIPQAMAYGFLAGFPPVYGLYACLVPLLVYPIFGGSSYLSVGPVAIISILTLASLSAFAEPFSPEYIKMGIFVAFLAGLFQCLFAILRFGFLVNFLSHPVISGFTSAAAIIIILSQLKHFFGLELSACSTALENCQNLIPELINLDIPTTLIGIGSLCSILLAKKISKKIPIALIVVIVTSLCVYFLKLENVNIIESIPAGLPSFNNPVDLNTDKMINLIPLGLIIALISFVESLVIAKTLGAKNGDHSLNANQELLGLGLAKILGSFFQAMPNSGSFSRSAINDAGEVQSGWTSIIAAILVACSLMFFTAFLYYIPFAALAAIIISAVFKLINFKEAKHLYKTDKSDFWILLITFLSTFIFGVQLGIISGIVLSILLLIKKVARPHLAVLGKVDEDGIYRNVKRFTKAEVVEQVLILRYDDDLFFGNAEHFQDSITTELENHPNTKSLVLDMSSVSNIDSTGIQEFKILMSYLQKKDIALHISGPKGPLRDRMNVEGIFQSIGKSNIHQSIEKSMQKIESASVF